MSLSPKAPLMRSIPRDLSVTLTDLTVHLARSHGSVHSLRPHNASSLFQIVRGKHQPFDATITHDSVDDFRDVGDRDMPVKKVIRFD
jgi:hypothetical protein